MAAHGREVGVFMGWWERLCYSLGIKLSPDKQAFAKEYLDDAGWFLFPK